MALFVVVQQGGSSCEWYTSFYDTAEEAAEAINSHREHTYDAIGPYTLEGEFTSEQLMALTDVFDDVAAHAVNLQTTRWLVDAHQKKFEGIHDR